MIREVRGVARFLAVQPDEKQGGFIEGATDINPIDK